MMSSFMLNAQVDGPERASEIVSVSDRSGSYLLRFNRLEERGTHFFHTRVGTLLVAGRCQFRALAGGCIGSFRLPADWQELVKP